MKHSYSSRAMQQGATLLVALVFLLAMTAAGVTAVRFATFEERMASNTQFSNQMFQQAQSELRAHMLTFNTNVALRAPLLVAKDHTPMQEADSTLALLPKTARVPIPLDVKTNNITSNSVGFVVETLCPGSSAGKFTCLHFEMQATAAVGTASSSQTQGITYEAAN